MSPTRRFQLDEVILRPGTYFNPQTEIMIIVDDSPEVDHEIFESGDFDSTDWVLIGEDTPVDEHVRDELVERFQRSHQAGGAPHSEHEDDLEELDEDDLDDDLDEDEEEDDELDGVDPLELDRE
jgi:hypothetical protein